MTDQYNLDGSEGSPTYPPAIKPNDEQSRTAPIKPGKPINVPLETIIAKADDELDRILKDFRHEINHQPGQATSWQWDEVEERHDKAEAEAKTQLRAYCLSQALELIGDDWLFAYEPAYDWSEPYNQAKAEIREKFRSLYGN